MLHKIRRNGNETADFAHRQWPENEQRDAKASSPERPLRRLFRARHNMANVGQNR